MTRNHNKRDNETPLESWKEISAYLKRDVRTVARWEKTEGLPVRRHKHRHGSTVYAYPSELEAWRAARAPQAGGELQRPTWRRQIPALAGGLALLAVAVIVQWGPIMNPPDPLAEAANTSAVSTRQIWTRNANFRGTPSPDGTFFSCIDWTTGDVGICDPATGQIRKLTNKGTWEESSEYGFFSSVSRDGQQVVYSWFVDAGTDLRVVDIQEPNPRVLVSDKEIGYLIPYDWSPDGKLILTTLARTDNTWQIAFVSVEDGAVRVVKSLDWRQPRKMSLSPDGRWIVYDLPVSLESQMHDIHLLAADGSKAVTLAPHPADDQFPIWTPDGNNVVFLSKRSGTTDLWMVRAQDGKPIERPLLLKHDLGRAVPMGFSTNGTLFYGLATGMSDVYLATIAPETGALISAPERATDRFVGANSEPAWSPDGKQLAYLSARGYQKLEGPPSTTLAILTPQSGEARYLNLSSEFDVFGDPRWFPDGRAILVRGRDRKGRWGLFRIDGETAETTLFISDTIQAQAAWSVDGLKLYYVAREWGKHRSQIRVRDLETGQETTLVPRPAEGYGLNNLALSPDGLWLAYGEGTTVSAKSIHLVETEGGDPRKLFPPHDAGLLGVGKGLLHNVEWAPDGKHLVFAQAGKIWKIAVEGRAAEEINIGLENATGLRFHPDGRRVALSAGEAKSEVWVMENFLPELRAEK